MIGDKGIGCYCKCEIGYEGEPCIVIECNAFDVTYQNVGRPIGTKVAKDFSAIVMILY